MRAATATLDVPSAQARMILARCTKLLGSERERLILVSSDCWSSLSSSGAIGRPRGMGKMSP